MNPLLAQQQSLQSEARELLDKLQLLSHLEKIGETTVVGSVELGLMTWRDIDIEVLVDNPDKSAISQIMGEVMKSAKRRIDFTFLDNTDLNKSQMPKGLYLGIKYEVDHDTDIVWKMDIWFSPQRNNGYIQTEAMKGKVSDEQKLAILAIKNEIWMLPTYKKIVQSVDIYDAVLHHDVKDIEGFKSYLQTKGKSLD